MNSLNTTAFGGADPVAAPDAVEPVSTHAMTDMACAWVGVMTRCAQENVTLGCRLMRARTIAEVQAAQFAYLTATFSGLTAGATRLSALSHKG